MRRDPLDIMRDILRLLEEANEALTINAISERTGIHNITVRKYVRMIEMVKSERIEIIRTRRSTIVRIRRDETNLTE